jgi:hypothetical protein
VAKVSEEQFRKISEKMTDDDGGGPPDHAVRQIVALMGGDEALYIDAVDRQIQQASWAYWAGIVITSDRVVYAEIRVPHRPSATSGTLTEISTWARRQLLTASIPNPDPAQNPGATEPAERWRHAGDGWPSGARLSLQYAGRQYPITLPLRDHGWVRQEFQQVLPDLLADIAR